MENFCEELVYNSSKLHRNVIKFLKKLTVSKKAQETFCKSIFILQ